MPLEFRPVTVVLKGVAQNFDDKTRPSDLLTYAKNVEFDRDGVLNKRRGYQIVGIDNVVGEPFGPDDFAIRLATRADELLVITHDQVLALGSKDEALRGADAFTYRGPNNRGHVRLRSITVSTATDEAGTL